jgi:geranylgeranyl reductase family protein
MLIFDAVVVGSGPSGAMAAYEMAKAGLKVAILEKDILPRYKTCGGGLVFRGRDMLPFDITSAIEREYPDVDVYFEETEKPYSTHREFPIITMIMRDKLDQLLVNEAVKLGAQLIDGQALKSLDFGDQIKVITEDQSFFTSYLVGADGVLSTTAKLAGWSETRKLIPALEFEVGVNFEDFERLSKEVRFDFDVIPNGYGWCFPKANHLSIGVGIFTRKKIKLKDYYESYLKKLGINEMLFEEAHGFQIPVAPRTDGFVKKNVFLVGDAAGLADPLTAEGITNGIHSGILAGKAIAQHFGNPAEAQKAYYSSLEERILPELRFSEQLARFFYGFPTIRNYFVRRNGERYCEIMTDLFTGKMSLSRDVKDRIINKFNLMKIVGM